MRNKDPDMYKKNTDPKLGLKRTIRILPYDCSLRKRIVIVCSFDDKSGFKTQFYGFSENCVMTNLQALNYHVERKNWEDLEP